jgi:hypothetical protein
MHSTDVMRIVDGERTGALDITQLPPPEKKSDRW